MTYKKAFLLIALAASTLAMNGSMTNTAEAQVKKSVSSNRVKAVTAKSTNSKPRYHIDFKQSAANQSTKPFQSMSASMPDKAVKTYLHKIKAEPNAMSGIPPSGTGTTADSAGAGQINSNLGDNKTGTEFNTGEAPRVLSPSGVAIPQSSGASSSFFK